MNLIRNKNREIDLNKRTENSIRNSYIGILVQFFQTIASFACRMVFVRYLSQEYLGINGLFVDIISVLSVAELGIGSAITFELYKALVDNDNDLISALMNFYKKAYAIIGLVIAAAGVLVLPFIERIVNKDPAISESIYVLFLLYLAETVISYFFSYKQTIIQAAQQNYIVSIIEATTGILKNTVQIFVLIMTHNFILYLCMQIFFRLINNIIMVKIANNMFPILKKQEVKLLPNATKKRLLLNVRYIFVTNIFNKLVNSTDTIIITSLIGLSVAGINSNYTLIISTIALFTSKILDGVTASIGNINAVEGDEKKLSSFYLVYLIFYWLLLWCTCCFIELSSDVIRVFFGSDYVMPMTVTIICGLNFMQQQLFNAVTGYRATLGLFKYGRYTTLATGIINIVASIILGKAWGIFGILFATFIARMITIDWYFPYVTYKYGFHKSPKEYYIKSFIYWAEAGVVIFTTYMICNVMTSNSVFTFLYRIAVCILVPNLIIVCFNYRNPEFKSLMLKVKYILIQKKGKQ